MNNVSAAHQHAGAVDALDEVIRRIQQQGTTGLVDDLIAEASEEATQGSKQYADGQSQLSAAMIPYSMKYTDVYTANLSARRHVLGRHRLREPSHRRNQR